MESAEVLALVGGHVEKEILLRNEYLAAENEILKSKMEGRPRLNDEERVRLAKIGERLGRKAVLRVSTSRSFLHGRPSSYHGVKT